MKKLLKKMKTVKAAVLAEAALDPDEVALENLPEFFKTELWPASLKVVASIMGNAALQRASEMDKVLSFCPMCGQRPQDDRRKDEARRMLMQMCPGSRRSDVDLALSLAYWVKL